MARRERVRRRGEEFPARSGGGEELEADEPEAGRFEAGRGKRGGADTTKKWGAEVGRGTTVPSVRPTARLCELACARKGAAAGGDGDVETCAWLPPRASRSLAFLFVVCVLGRPPGGPPLSFETTAGATQRAGGGQPVMPACLATAALEKPPPPICAPPLDRVAAAPRGL